MIWILVWFLGLPTGAEWLDAFELNLRSKFP